MDFFLFLLVNATLFIRPAEIVPDLQALPIYNWLIVINLFAAGPGIIDHLTQGSIREKPVTVCVLGVFAGVFLSHFVKLDLWSARFGALEFAKVVAYYLILVVTVNTRTRFAIFLTVAAALILTINGLAVLHYHGVIEIPSLTVLMQNDYDPLTGERFVIPRMQATGIFGDPNDLSMIIVAGSIMCLAGFFYRGLGLFRFLLLAPTAFLVYSLTLTQSRGGLLAFIAALGVMVYLRFGKLKSVALGVVVVPVVLAGFGGRQSDIGGALTGGTGAARAELWSDGLQEFKRAPVFGIGYKMYHEEVGQVAHNSFVHVLVELGLLGGTPFLGVFVLLAFTCYRLRSHRLEIRDAALHHLYPFVFAILVAYIISMMSLSRAYSVPTYFVAGLAASYVTITQGQTSLKPITLSPRLCVGLLLGSIGFLGFIYIYIRFLLRMG